MQCLMCGQENSDELAVCPNCNAPIPKKQTGISSAPPTKVFERYNKIKTYTEQAQSGEISLDEFKDFLSKTKEALLIKEKDIKEIEIPEEYYNDFLTEMEVGFVGLKFFYDGIEELLLYINDKNEDHITKGLALVYEGNEFVNEAMCINREHRRVMEELYLGSNLL